MHADHKVPWSSGGKTTLGNLIAACRKCNLAKGRMSYRSFIHALNQMGLGWRDQRAEKMEQRILSSQADQITRTPGVSNPRIGLAYKARAQLRAQ